MAASAALNSPAFRAVFRLALRQTEGLIGSVTGLPGLDLALPDRGTSSVAARRLGVTLKNEQESTVQA